MKGEKEDESRRNVAKQEAKPLVLEQYGQQNLQECMLTILRMQGGVCHESGS